jgi:NAD(P)-dependent dehydrogenase (short-subunit alcohol dehydrogenase family)
MFQGAEQHNSTQFQGSNMSHVLLVTGAAGGLGRAVVTRAALTGVKIAVVSRDAQHLVDAFGAAEASPHAHIVADVSTHEGAQLAVKTCIETLGSPTMLAHCVGNILLAPAARTTEAQYRDVMRANLDSAFFMLGAFALAARNANIAASACFVSTIAAGIGIANHEAVAAAKGGLEAMVRSAAATYAANGLRFNAVAPGLMDTPAAAKFLASPALREASAKQYPLGSIGTADEIAEVMLWLLSDAARRVTGQTWTVDGGFTTVRPLVR